MTTDSNPTPARPLAGQHALVTGAARGIGRAIAGELVRLGASVTLGGRDADALAAAERDLAAVASAPVGSQRLPVDEPDAVASAVSAAMKERGPIAILVNNAGVAPSAPVDKLYTTTWTDTFTVNVTGPLWLIQGVLPAMRQARYGRIVNIGSTAGLRGYPFVAAYVASKHALIGLTRALALELARTGITVNAVCPGYTDTDMAAAAIGNIMSSGKSEDEARTILARGNPMGRLIEPREVADAVGWLCLPGSAAVTGQAIAVAGGEVM